MRHRRPVSEPARPRPGAVRRRKKPDSSAESHAASSAHGTGYVEGVTHDYVRHGTTTLFAALDIATGAVFTECKPRHRHQEFLSFLRREAAILQQLDVHLILDNYATHKHPKVRTWLAKRPRYHIHYIPTYSSWLNQVERWFGLITQRPIVAAPSAASKTSSKRSMPSCSTTTAHIGPLSGRLPRIRSCKRSPDFIHVFTGQHTSYFAVQNGAS